MDDLRKSIVGILSKSSSPKYAGTGFFVTGGLILTCAHVLKDAQTVNDEIIFCLDESNKRYNAKVLFKSDTFDLDIAVLQPLNLTEPAPALPLIFSRQSDGHEFKSFGYPLEGNGQGLHGDGKIHNWVRDSLERDALQISSNKITHGFSGCPIWDNQLGGVVGMVSSGFDFGLDKKLGDVTFAIPSEVLKAAYSALQVDEAIEEKPDSTIGNTSASIGQNVTDSIINAGNHNVFNIYNGAPAPKAEQALQLAIINDQWYLAHPYAMPENFTGRYDERAMLTRWLKTDLNHPLMILRALGGFGKSALTWHWLMHDAEAQAFPKVVWWSFYEADASFENFLTKTLTYLGLPNAENVNTRHKTELLLHRLQKPGLLLILDGFERELRAYGNMSAAYQADEIQLDGLDGENTSRDCVNPYTDAFLRGIGAFGDLMRSKVLITTRLTPRAVESQGSFLQGCREEELGMLDKKDAVNFFYAQGIRGGRSEIETACAAYGYHPLSLRILAGWVANDRRTPGDIAIAERLNVTDDIIQNKHHILEMAFNTLNASQKKLLGRIACFRAPMSYEAIRVVYGSGKGNDIFDATLQMLEKRGLLHWDRKTNQYDLHPIVRRYAYERLTTPDRTAAHTRLRDYFAAVDTHAAPQTFDEFTPVIELYHHTVLAGRYDDAYQMYAERLRHPLYYKFGTYELDLQLLLAIPRSRNGVPRLSSSRDQIWNLYYATLCCERLGRLELGLNLVQQTINLAQTTKDSLSLGSAQGTFAIISSDYGNLQVANNSIIESVKIFDNIGDANWRGISHRGYGKILAFCGIFDRSEQEFEIAQSAYNQGNNFHHGLSLLSIYKGQLFLWQNKPQKAFECAQQAHKFSAQNYIRENISADWLAGISLTEIFSQEPISQKTIQVEEIENYLTAALTRCRQINLVELEPDILLAWARWNHLLGNSQKALKDAEEALVIANRCKYRFKQANIHNFLAQYLLEHKHDKTKAKEYAESALKLAYCDGPPYYYKVAYDEAGRLIERLNSEG